MTHVTFVEWTHDWPTEPGWYWFYGTPYNKNQADARLCPVEIHQGGNSLLYILGAGFIYQSEASNGLWTKMIVPKLPEEDT